MPCGIHYFLSAPPTRRPTVYTPETYIMYINTVDTVSTRVQLGNLKPEEKTTAPRRFSGVPLIHYKNQNLTPKYIVRSLTRPVTITAIHVHTHTRSHTHKRSRVNHQQVSIRF